MPAEPPRSLECSNIDVPDHHDRKKSRPGRAARRRAARQHAPADANVPPTRQQEQYQHPPPAVLPLRISPPAAYMKANPETTLLSAVSADLMPTLPGQR